MTTKTVINQRKSEACYSMIFHECESANPSGTTTKAIRLFLIAFVVFDRLWLEGRSVTMVLRLGEVAVDLVDKGVGVGHAGEGGGDGESRGRRSRRRLLFRI